MVPQGVVRVDTNLTGETWGMSGTSFLVLYVFLAVTATVLAGWYRSRTAAGAPAGARVVDGRPEDVAYLNGGSDLAVYAALSAMHVDGTIVTSDRTTGQVRAGGPLTRSATDLQRAIHRSAHRLTPRRTLRTHAAVQSELRRIGQRLETAGLLLSATERTRYRAAAALPGLVAALGLARAAADAATMRPVGVLILLSLVQAVIATGFVLAAPLRTRAGDAALSRTRVEHHTLSASMCPDWTVIGPAGAALSVGAFGLGAMLAAEPVFADELAAQTVPALGGAPGGDAPGGGAGASAGSGGDGGGGGFGGDGGGGFGG